MCSCIHQSILVESALLINAMYILSFHMRYGLRCFVYYIPKCTDQIVSSANYFSCKYANSDTLLTSIFIDHHLKFKFTLHKCN